MFSKKTLFIGSTLALTSLLGGCVSNLSPNMYNGNTTGVASSAAKGTIVSIRQVRIQQNSHIGALSGAVAGGAAGSLIGDRAAVSIASAAGGALLGGLIGNEAEKQLRKDVGYEYIIRLNSGSMVSVTQQQDLQLGLNQHVLVIYGPTTRIVPDNTVSAPRPRPSPVATSSKTTAATNSTSKTTATTSTTNKPTAATSTTSTTSKTTAVTNTTTTTTTK